MADSKALADGSGKARRLVAARAAAIVVDRVSKQYRRAAHAHRFLTLKSAVLGGNLFQLLSPDEVFTALDDVSVTIEKGETFGVIGSNGAGKSTLLKIIAGTTKPTSGEVDVEGKISALIELGAGFHPEISGRENVYINGIMLGLSRGQIDERFDEIVRFAELEEFIEAPVKTYSSGMYMRLGFSVAIHVDPDVLLIDEVLAVGDEAFVHKCIDKIAAFKRRGKTILLVSHGLESVRRLCDRALWLQGGRAQLIGDPPRVVDAYLDWVASKEEEELAARHRRRTAESQLQGSNMQAGPRPRAPGTRPEQGDVAGAPPDASGAAAAPSEPGGVAGGAGAGAASVAASARATGAAAETGAPAADDGEPPTPVAGGLAPDGGEPPEEPVNPAEAPYEPGRWGSRQVVITDTSLLDVAGKRRYVFACGEPMTIELQVSAAKPVDDFVFGIGVFNSNGVCCYGTNTHVEGFEPRRLAGEATVRISIPALNLVEGTYYLDVAAHRRDGYAYDYQRGLCTFRMTSTVPDVGVARLPHGWEFTGVEWKQSGGSGE